MSKDKILYWTSTVIIVIWEGLMPLGTLIFSPEYITYGTKPLGYPDYFAYALVACKVLGTLAIAIPKVQGSVKEWAYAGLFFNLIFAVISHACVDKNINFILMPVVVGLILAASYVYNRKVYHGQNKLQHN